MKTVGFIGFGSVARTFHGPLLATNPKLRLTHVLERRHNRSSALYPDVTVVRTTTELLRTDIDLVVILTPNESHFTLAKEALLANKHVVIDKPMTVTSAQADELISLAEERQLLLSVFHNRRWDSDFLTLRGIIKQGALGSVVSLESHFDRFRPRLKGGWKEHPSPGTGLLYDLGSHLLDQCFQLFGHPKSLLADLRKERERATTCDSFQVLLDYGPLKADLQASCVAAEPKLRFKVRGTKGAWVKYGEDPQEAALQSRALPQGSNWGKDQAAQWGHLYSVGEIRTAPVDEGKPYPSHPGNYPEYYRLLAEALEHGTAPPVLASEARDVIRAIELCLESHQNRCWVDWS
jgi:predicted dehydrogenase